MNTIVTLDHHPISNHPLFPLYVHDHSHQISLMINVRFTQFNHPEVITNFMVGLFTTPNLLYSWFVNGKYGKSPTNHDKPTHYRHLPTSIDKLPAIMDHDPSMLIYQL